MNRKDLIQGVVASLKGDNIRKEVPFPRQTFHISDDAGHKRDFVVKRSDKRVIYNEQDVGRIIDTAIEVVKNSIKRGDNISIRSFGTLGLIHRKGRNTTHPSTGELVVIPPHYVPKFEPASDLRACAKLFEMSLAERDLQEMLKPENDQMFAKLNEEYPDDQYFDDADDDDGGNIEEIDVDFDDSDDDGDE